MKTHREILRGLREDNDMKQTAVAALIGKTQQQYSKYETGENELTFQGLNILASHYNVSVDYLMGRTGCKEGINALSESITAEFTVGEAATEVLSLNETNRAAVIEFILFLKARERAASVKQKKQAGECE